MVHSGPIQKGTSTSVFRATGKSVPAKEGESGFVGPLQKNRGSSSGGKIFSGPVRQETDVEVFRATGKSVPKGSIQAQTLRAEIATKAKVEQSRIQDQQKARQEKVFSQTIEGQVKAGKEDKIFSGPIQKGIDAEVFRSTGRSVPIVRPSVIDVAPSPTQQAFDIGTGVPKSAPKFNVELVKKAGRQFFFVEDTPIQAVGTLFSPLQKFFPGKKGDVEFQSPKFGTRSDQPLPFGAGGGETTTSFNIARQEALADPSLLLPPEVQFGKVSSRIQKELVADIQPKVTSGEITVEQAEKEFETQFGTEFEKRKPDVEKGIKFRGRVTRLEEPSFDVKSSAEFLAIGAGSITPVGSAIIGASFVAEGLPKVTGGDTLTERGLGLVEVGFGLGVRGLAFKGAERIATRSARKEAEEILLKRELELVSLPQQRFRALEGLEKGFQKRGIEIPPPTESLIVSQETLFAGTEKKLIERATRQLSPKELEQFGLSFSQKGDIVGLERLTVFGKTTKIKPPQVFEELGTKIDFGKLAPLEKSPFILEGTTQRNLGIISGVSEKEITRGFGAQFRVGSRERLVDKRLFSFKGGEQLETGETLFTAVQFEPARKGRRKVGEFIVETFPIGRVTERQFIKIPKPKVIKDEFSSFAEFESLTFTQQVRPQRVSDIDFLKELTGKVPKKVRGTISSREFTREITIPKGARIDIKTAEGLTEKGFEKQFSVKIEQQFITGGKSERLLPATKGVRDVGGFDLGVGASRKTPFDKTFGDSGLVQKQVQETILKSIIPQPSIKPPRTTPRGLDLGGIPRAVGGGGLTPLQLRQAGGGGLTQIDFVDTGLKPLITRHGISERTFVESDIISKAFIPSGTKTFTDNRLGVQVLDTQLKPVGSKVFTDLSSQGETQIIGQKIKTLPDLASGFSASSTPFFEPRIEPKIKPPIKPRRPFEPFESSGFGVPFAFPPLLGGAGTRPKKQKRARPRIPIRPSFTGIVLGIEEAPIISPTLGLVPGQIRGLETGFDVPKRKKKKSKTPKKKTKKSKK